MGHRGAVHPERERGPLRQPGQLHVGRLSAGPEVTPAPCGRDATGWLGVPSEIRQVL